MARERLLNRQIVEVRYLNPAECHWLMWDRTSVAIVLDNGTIIYAARDAEGNCHRRKVRSAVLDSGLAHAGREARHAPNRGHWSVANRAA